MKARVIPLMCVLALALSGCVVGSKADLYGLLRTYFETGFNCGRHWPERTFDQCWSRYEDIGK